MMTLILWNSIDAFFLWKGFHGIKLSNHHRVVFSYKAKTSPEYSVSTAGPPLFFWTWMQQNHMSVRPNHPWQCHYYLTKQGFSWLYHLFFVKRFFHLKYPFTRKCFRINKSPSYQYLILVGRIWSGVGRDRKNTC